MLFLRKWRWEIVSPFAGILLTLAFAPFSHSYLAIISLVLAFSSWLGETPFRVAIRGYLYGLGLFGSGISWVYISIHDFGGAPKLGAILLTLMIVCFWSLFPALTAYLAVKITVRQQNKKIIWIFPFVWILVEYFRGYWLLNGFPWLQIAYSLLETPLQGFVPIIGAYGSGFLLAITATTIVAGFNKLIKFHSSVIIISLIWGFGAYLQSVQWTMPVSKALNVALIQGNINQDQKWLPENRIKTMVYYQKMTAQNWDADIIIWPETAIPAYFSQVKDFYLEPLSDQAQKNNATVIVSLPSKGKNNENYNTVLTLGNHQGRYHKNHLLPFGEYLPLQPVSGFILDSLNIKLGNFSSGGDNQTLLIAGGYPFATSICYEDAFAEEAIRAMPEAAFLVNVTNDAWFGNSIEPHQHMQLAQMRALETGRYMLRTTNTGVTAIVAADGAIVSKAPLFKKTVLKGQIYPMTGMTPYARLGDKVILIIILGGCLISLIVIPKKAKATLRTTR